MSNKSPLLLGTSTERERATRIGILRICVGGTLMVPAVARRIFGIPDNQDTPSLRMLARLFAVRNIALGVWALAARDRSREERLLVYRLNAVVDAVDVVALAWSGISGEGLKQAAIMGGVLGSSVLVGWVELIQEVSAGESAPSLEIA